MAKFTIKTLMELMGKDLPNSSNWLSTERSWLLDYAQKNPVRVRGSLRQIRQKGFIFPFRLNLKHSPMFISLILAASLLLSGGGVLAAAQNDLPDERLYGVKIAGEKVRAAVTTDVQARTELRANFAKKRLEEIKAVNKKPKLTSEARVAAIARAEANYRANLEAAESDVVEIDSKNDVSGSVETSTASKLEGELSTQEKVLLGLETDVRVRSKKSIRRALVKAQGTRGTASAIKAGLKVEADAKTGADKSLSLERARAEGRLEAAENKLRSSREVVNRIEGGVSSEGSAKLKLALEAITRAKTNFESKAYGEAWLEASTSIKLSIEAVLTAVRLEQDSEQDDSSDHDEDEEDEVKVNAESSTSININAGSIIKLR